MPNIAQSSQLTGVVLRNLMEAHVQTYYALKKIDNKAQIGALLLAIEVASFAEVRRDE